MGYRILWPPPSRLCFYLPSASSVYYVIGEKQILHTTQSIPLSMAGVSENLMSLSPANTSSYIIYKDMSDKLLKPLSIVKLWIPT